MAPIGKGDCEQDLEWEKIKEGVCTSTNVHHNKDIEVDDF